MLGPSGKETQIAWQLKDEYKVELSEEDWRKFSDFLLAKDPYYVSWTKYVTLRETPQLMRLENMRPYYEAYLEFRQSKHPLQ
jgi:hypothetical protein